MSRCLMKFSPSYVPKVSNMPLPVTAQERRILLIIAALIFLGLIGMAVF